MSPIFQLIFLYNYGIDLSAVIVSNNYVLQAENTFFERKVFVVYFGRLQIRKFHKLLSILTSLDNQIHFFPQLKAPSHSFEVQIRTLFTLGGLSEREIILIPPAVCSKLPIDNKIDIFRCSNKYFSFNIGLTSSIKALVVNFLLPKDFAFKYIGCFLRQNSDTQICKS